MDEPRLVTESEAFELVGHLLAAAEIHEFEPHDYVTMRLLDAASKMLGYMSRDQSSPSHDWIAEFRRDLDAKKTLRTRDREAYQAFLKAAPVEVVRELKRRQATGQPVAVLES